MRGTLWTTYGEHRHRGFSRVVTWEMADGTEIRYEGAGIEPAALREFVLRFMGSQGKLWDAMQWSDDDLASAFEQRFAKRVEVTRERRGDGATQFVIRPRLAFA